LFKSIQYSVLYSLLFSLLISSCTVVRKFPKEHPFHFENNIKFEGKLSKQEKAKLKDGLLSQVEDSVQIRVASRIPWPSFPWIIPVQVMDNPSMYNDYAVKQSASNMNNFMSSMGYRKNSIRVDSLSKIKKGQKRVYTTFSIYPGPLFTIDSISYLFSDEMKRSLGSDSFQNESLKKNTPFSYSAIDVEISRLTERFQNNGYYKITQEDIIAEVDTSSPVLLNAGMDVFSHALQFRKAALKSLEPTVSIQFRLRDGRDSTHLHFYRIGKIEIYPDLQPEFGDTIMVSNESDNSGIRIHSILNSFDERFIRENILLKSGGMFNRDDYNRTLNNFNRLGTWQNINMISETDEINKLVHYTLRMQPAKRQFFSIDLEGSSIINTSQMVQVGTGRVGLANNFTLRNRNIGKKAIQLENNLRTGIEFNNFKKILSGEISLTNRLTFPRMVAPVSDKLKSYFQQARTVVSADISYIDRFQFFKLNTFNTYLGYEWKPNPATTWQFRPLNFEYTRFTADSLFLESIRDFPLLLYTYNNGLIIGMNALYNRNLTPNNNRKTSLLKVYAEESGLATGALLGSLTDPGKALTNLYRFVKMDVEFKHIITHQNSSLHFRAFAGGGIALPTGSRKGQVTLPFFKSYIAGGPNSMRGWSIRKLGIGSNIFYDTVANGRFNDKYADMQLEANLEFRFNLFPFYGFWMRGAVFTDIGNIWFRNDLDGTLKNAGFRLKQLGKDIAVASGLGARVDFNYFLLRFDLGFPVKDPRYGPDNRGNQNIERFYAKSSGGWFVDNVWNKPTFQFAIGYPF
jgi:outer membrane protein assembly factor BamA